MQGAPHGTLICAREQASGRGRFGRAFYSPAESGVYMSLILRPQLPAERSVLLTSMTAVAVARAIERLADVEVKIKWVNDLFIGDRKVCGILCEAGMDFESGQLEYAVVGIGVNTARAAFPAELAAVATSVGNACGSDVSNNRLIAEICNEMEALYPELASGEFMAESRARSNVVGRRVMVARGEERFTATALDIDEQGGLVVRTEAGGGDTALRRGQHPHGGGAMTAKELVWVALMAALICIAAPLAVPVGAIPITLATFAVYLAGALLGMKRGRAPPSPSICCWDWRDCRCSPALTAALRRSPVQRAAI